MKNKPYFILTAILIFLCTRFLYLFFLNDPDLMTNLKLVESQYIGVVAKHILEGLIMPLWDYQYSSYDGGTLIAGVLLTPLFLLFGQNSISHSLYGLIAQLITMIVWWKFLCQYFGKRIAKLFVVMFVLAPPLYIKETLVVAGNHMEIDLFIILVIYLFYDIFSRSKDDHKTLSKPNSMRFILLGFIAGLGVYYCYSLAVLLLTCFLFWCALDKTQEIKRNYLFLSLFFLLGISFIFPRLTIFNSLIKEDIVDQWTFSNIAEFPIRFFGAAVLQLPKMISLASPLHYGLYWLFIGSVLITLVNNRVPLNKYLAGLLPIKTKKIPLDEHNKTVFFILFIIIYLSIYAASDFNLYMDTESPLRHRYLYLLFPFIFFFTSVGIDYVCTFQKAGKIGTILLVGYIVMAGIAGSFQQLDFTNFRQKIHTRLTRTAYSHEMLGTVICTRFCHDPQESVRLLDSVKKRHVPEIYRGFGYEFATGEHQNIEYYKLLMKNNLHRLQFLKGVAIGNTAIKYFKETDLERAYLYEVISFNACQDIDALGRKLLHYVDTVTFNDKSPYYEGIAVILSLQCNINQAIKIKMVSQIDSKYHESFYTGIAKGIKYNLDILSDIEDRTRSE